MRTARHTESDFEQTTIDRLRLLTYPYRNGGDIVRSGPEEVVLFDELDAFLKTHYPDLPDDALALAVERITRPYGVDTLRRNMAFHTLLREGFDLKVEYSDGRAPEFVHLSAIDWDEPNNNRFLVVNQLPIHHQNDRRPDILVYVNGLPLVLFELKNPYSEHPTVEDALNQIHHYVNEVPQLFDYNAITVASDGTTTLHGVWTASQEWYAPWKSINGHDAEPNTTGSMKTLIEGLFPKDRLLDYLRDFIVFENANEKITKKAAKYHQFFAVRIAAEKTVEAVTTEGKKKVGVVWHTTGSGKSLSMAFLVGILRREPALNNPSFVIEVDRNDLDDQLHDQFVAVRSLVGNVHQAEYASDLRQLLQTEGGEVIFTTIEKFRLKDGELQHPILSERSNIVIIADEAHRSQYGFDKGYARYLAEALPNARRLGFTGTPVSLSGADTTEVFGDVIHTYDIRQSQEDNATVKIFYDPRLIKLNLQNKDLDKALDEVAEGVVEGTELERGKSRWAALASAAGTKERAAELARDLLTHFKERTATLEGKAMVVCMTRTNCVGLYNALTALPDCPEVKVVMTGDLSKDPEAWSKAGHFTTQAQREAIKKRMVDPDDPLKIVIVCDMWLTGTDIPCLHTLYVDKPMRGHNMIQAISRVNRVFRDKPHGLIVDYIGIGDELREATSKYTTGGGTGEPAPDLEATAGPLFDECLANVRKLLPTSHDYGAWRRLSGIGLEDLYSLVYGTLTDSDEIKEAFLAAELKLSSAFLLVKHLDNYRRYADEVIFCQRVRQQLAKTLPGQKAARRDLDHAVRDIIDESVASEGVVDIFQAAGLDRADISILDDKFLQTFKNRPHENLRIKLLDALLRDAINLRRQRNLTRARSFQEMLENTIRDYHNRVIDAAAVVEAMIKIRQEIEEDERRARELGLSDDELAFYDAIAQNYASVYEQGLLRDIIHNVVQTIKRNLKVDWTEEHRDNIKAAVRLAVKKELKRQKVRTEDLEPFLKYFMEQAEALYSSWPLLAA